MSTSYSGGAIPEKKILLVWSFTVWLVVMNTTMFNVALPTVLDELSLTSSTVAWIVSGYSVTFAISALTFSRLSDYIPISTLLLIGLFLLSGASIIGFFSHHFFGLLAARVLQAAGAGAVPGLAMVLAGRYIPLSRRGRAMALIASAASLGFGLGPVIGGAITQYLGWNYLFAITCFVVLMIPLFRKLLPKETVKKGHFDFIGAVFTGLGIAGLLLFISTLSYFLLFGVFIIGVILWRHLHRIDGPFLQPALLKNHQYIKLLYISFTAFITHFSSLFLMPIILTTVHDKGAAEVGLIIFPGAILSAFAARIIGNFIDRFGNKPVIIFGESMLIIAVILFAFLSTKSPYFILGTYMFMSLGFTSLTSSLSNEMTRILHVAEIGSGMGMAQLVQFISGGIGVTITGLVLTLQKGAAPEIIYRNIFFGLAFLISFSFFIFVSYYQKARRENQPSYSTHSQ
jgi:DHA2 family metal-tetracycline-proton antiporter-like MFS transporter